jgi:AbrB family transcriptional regulator (stage V sporulation protein T)
MCIKISLFVILKIYKIENTNKEEKLMKATGVVRRIDDLGRIVIPKEIRRVLRIKERRST